MAERDFVLSTETTCDMPMSYYAQQGVNLLGLTFTIDGVNYNSVDSPMTSAQFYAKVREGALPKTAQVSVAQASASFERLVEEGKDILHLAFSSGLSGTCQACALAAREVMERHPGSRIVVVDSLAASMGQGLMLHYLVTLKQEGKTLDQCRQLVEENRLRFCHNFTVDDLFHLHRGGRVSKMSAVLGTALGIKPALHVDDEGHLINVAKVRGRRQSLDWLVDRMAEHRDASSSLPVFISHGDCLEDAQYVAGLVTKRFGITDISIGDIGPVIGSHSGPGTVALFFLGDSRHL